MAARPSTTVARKDEEGSAPIECFPDLLVVGLEDWDDVERRHQLLLKEICRRQPECRVLFVEVPARPTLPGRLRGVALRRVTDNVSRTRIVRPLNSPASA